MSNRIKILGLVPALIATITLISSSLYIVLMSGSASLAETINFVAAIGLIPSFALAVQVLAGNRNSKTEAFVNINPRSVSFNFSNPNGTFGITLDELGKSSWYILSRDYLYSLEGDESNTKEFAAGIRLMSKK